MMKKSVFVAVVLCFVFALTGCSNPFINDKSHAILTVATSDGRANIFESYNGLNMTCSGETAALRRKLCIELEEGQNVTCHFECPACSYVRDEVFESTCGVVFSCECPEEGDEENNAKEYIAIVVEKQ